MFNLKDFAHYSPILVETGTCKGDGVQRALDAGFEKILTVEADYKLFSDTRQRYSGNEKVYTFFGQSVELLKFMLDVVQSKRCVFFLDAHPAGPNTYGHEELLAGDIAHHQDTIIKKELEIILGHRGDHVILIDDQRGLDPFSTAYIAKARQVNFNYQYLFYDNGKILALFL